MTIDEAIAYAREVAEAQRKICETHIFFDNVTFEEFYADDTEIIEKALYEHKLCAEEHEQLAEWLEELKKLRERIEIQKECMTDSYLLGKYDGIKQGRTDAIEVCAELFADTLSNMTQICGNNCPIKCSWGTEETCKDMCKKWFIEQLKEQNNGGNNDT